MHKITVMKKFILLAAMLLTAALPACTTQDDDLPGSQPEQPADPGKPAPDEPDTPENPPVASTGFGWSTLARTDLSLESPVAAGVSIYTDASCTDARMLVLNAVLEAGVARTFPLTLPADAEKLYVKYPAQSGGKEVAEVRLLPTRSGEVSTVEYKFPTGTVSTTYEDNDGFTYYHNSGVVMVEDQWPDFSISDADFNDLVMEYDLKATECNVPALLPAHGYKEGLVITLDIRGVGSGRTKQAGLQLCNFDPSSIKSIETVVYEKSGQGVMKELTDHRFRIEVDKTQSDRLLILFDGLENLVQGKHYQTTQGEIIAGQPMIRAYIKLTGVADRSQLSDMASLNQLKTFRSAVFNTDNHDFFMVLKPAYGSAEIHQKGFAPTYRYTQYETDSKGLMSDVPYCSKNNEVWVLRLPAGTRHPYDRTSIFKAYPDIAGWIESDGLLDREWYRNYVEELVVPWW